MNLTSKMCWKLKHTVKSCIATVYISNVPVIIYSALLVQPNFVAPMNEIYRRSCCNDVCENAFGDGATRHSDLKSESLFKK